jgi:hypothetical protein
MVLVLELLRRLDLYRAFRRYEMGNGEYTTLDYHLALEDCFVGDC